MSDFTNRRKELKFAATDLKLWRRDQETSIDHWRIWRQNSPPKTYFLWAARLRRGELKRFRSVPDKWVGRDVGQLLCEAQALVNSYLDGTGIFAWRLNQGGTAYESVVLPHSDQVSALDDVLYAMASEIKIASKGTAPPEPVRPGSRAVDPAGLLGEDPAQVPWPAPGTQRTSASSRARRQAAGHPKAVAGRHDSRTGRRGTPGGGSAAD